MKQKRDRTNVRNPVTAAPPKSETLSRFISKYSLPLILLVMLGALALRASDLRADPPPDLSWSTGPYTDEALNTYSARNMVLYGHWRMDDFFPLVVYPLVNYLMVLVFKLLGMGFVQVKLLSLLAGVASVLVIYLLVKEDAGHLAGLLAGLALATSFPLTMYSRLGLVETVQILFLLLTGLCYVRGLKRPWQMGLAGLLGASTILLVKVSAAFIAPALTTAIAWEFFAARKDRAAVRVMLHGIGWGFAGIGVALGIWLVIVFLPHRADYFQYVLRHSLESPAGHPQGPVAYLLNTFTVGLKSRLIPRLSWVALLGFLTLPVLASGRKPALRYLGLWFALALLMLGYMNYRPDRYELVLLPALIAGFAVALARIIETGALIPRLKPTLPKAGLYALWLWILATQLTYYTNGFWGTLRPRNESGLLVAALVISAAAGFLSYAVGRVARNGLSIRLPAARAAIALVLLLLTMRLDLAQYFRWFGSRTHIMVESGADLDRSLPDDAVLTGNWASALLIGSRKRAVPMTDWANADDPVGRFGATHLVSAENGFDFKLFSRLYPDMMPQARVFRRYEIRGIPLLIYELPKRGE
ncbi:MAG: glycosyltransferase family 39 protein [candidate division WOR-3 bacterium]|nr:glycosyltransferase family 39 protein [candidate division WOR-3 bacterium]